MPPARNLAFTLDRILAKQLNISPPFSCKNVLLLFFGFFSFLNHFVAQNFEGNRMLLYALALHLDGNSVPALHSELFEAKMC